MIPLIRHCQQLINVITCVHAYKMLLKIVQTRPDLVAFSTTSCKALVALGLATVLTMNGLLVSVQIIDSGKSLELSWTAINFTLEILFVSSYMLSTSLSVEAPCKQRSDLLEVGWGFGNMVTLCAREFVCFPCTSTRTTAPFIGAILLNVVVVFHFDGFVALVVYLLRLRLRG